MKKILSATLFAFVALFTAPASAEELVTSLSADMVSIQSNFTGTKIVIFGQVGRDVHTIGRPGKYDLAITVEGQKHDITTRRKARLAGVWVNRYYETFTHVPTFYAVATTRPVAELANRNTLDELQLGLNHINLAVTGRSHVPLSDRDDFRRAFLRLRQEQGLYIEQERSIEFLTDTMFRTTVGLPANIPVGNYTVRSFLFQDGSLISKTQAPLRVAKSGFEQITYDMANRQPLLYGVIAVAIAMLTGWFAGVIFRKD
ncbi:MAG: TIGR02186 family protein [Rhodobacteraceae bacterium]|nr:TIGR02186 family protein [Paracoccaceae bacterium]